MVKLLLTAAFGAALAASLPGASAVAAPELITNGDFETTTSGVSTRVTGSAAAAGNLAGWYMANPPGYTFLFLPGSGTSGTTADTVGATNQDGSSNLKLWGPGTGVNNGLTNSPAGGNFIAADNNYQQSAIQQNVGGLKVGATYALSFYWAAAQQAGFDGITQEQWSVTFGGQTFKTDQINLASHGFSGWTKAVMYFNATSANQVLSFLATGSPGGNPPFSLLDGVSLQQVVPEPASFAAFGVALLALAGAARLRPKRA